MLNKGFNFPRKRLVRLQHSSVRDFNSQTLKTIQPYINLPQESIFNSYVDAYSETIEHVQKIAKIDTSKFKLINLSKTLDLAGNKNFTISLDPANQVENIKIANSYNFVLDFQNLPVNYNKEKDCKFVVEIENCHSFSLKNINFKECRSGCLIINSRNFVISNLTVDNCQGYGVVIHNSHYFEIKDCYFYNNLASGVYCNGDTSYGLISRNTFSKSRGFFNWDAGLHINHCSDEITADCLPERSHEPKKILEKIAKPKFLFVEHNAFLNNRAQGIYCEGCLLSVFRNNVLTGNNKEGICFDWGSALNLFEDNDVSFNGYRGNMSPEEIKADFIEEFPLLEDNSSSCKLPGISLDNGCANYIIHNRIHSNFGAGIKLIRSAIANIISDNHICENGTGKNEVFKAFHAITFLGMGTVQNEFEGDKDTLLDFLPSAGNVVADNFCGGIDQIHYIYADKHCPANFVFDNNQFAFQLKNPVSKNLLVRGNNM